LQLQFLSALSFQRTGLSRYMFATVVFREAKGIFLFNFGELIDLQAKFKQLIPLYSVFFLFFRLPLRIAPFPRGFFPI
jgi:hypothetical protein